MPIPLSPTCLSTLQTVKAQFGIPASDIKKDDQITFAANAVSDAFANYCARSRYKFGLQSISEQTSAQGYQRLLTAHRPLVSITQITTGINDDQTGGNVLAASYYQIEDPVEGIVFNSRGWPDSRLGNAEAVFLAPRQASFYGGAIAGDSIQSYDPSPYAIRRNILVQYLAGYVLPQYLQQATSNGTAVLTGLAVTTNLAAGMPVSGNGVQTGATIQSVDSATQVTLTSTVTAGAPTVTFWPASVGVVAASRLPYDLESAVAYEVDRILGLTMARGLKTQDVNIGFRVQFYNETDIDPQVKRILNSYRNHCTG